MNNLFIRSFKIKKEIPEDNFLANLPVIKNLKLKGEVNFNKQVTFLVGENGIGKSTIIEAIAVAYGFNPEGGSKSFNFNTCNSHSDLFNYVTIVKGIKKPKTGFFLRSESFYNVASHIDKMDSEPSFDGKVIDAYGGVSLHKQSHGQSFLALVENRFCDNGIYILDEPEAALSPQGIMKLIVRMNELVRTGCQFIIATHSSLLMAFPDAEIYEFTEEDIKSVEYKNTMHYSLTRSFLENPERMLHMLLKD